MASLKIRKLEYFDNGTYFLYKIKIFLTCASDDIFLKSYRFVAEVTCTSSKILFSQSALISQFCLHCLGNSNCLTISFYVSDCSMAFYSSRKLPSKVPSDTG